MLTLSLTTLPPPPPGAPSSGAAIVKRAEVTFPVDSDSALPRPAGGSAQAAVPGGPLFTWDFTVDTNVRRKNDSQTD